MMRFLRQGHAVKFLKAGLLELVVLIFSVNSLCHPSMQILNKNIDLHASSETSLCGGMGCIFEAKFALCSVLAS